jgi:transposase
LRAIPATAGFCGFHLHRISIENNIHNIVVHPASIEICSRDRVKTDKRDSLKIATQLAAGRLRGIYIPDRQRECNRTITRLRHQLTKDKNRLSVQIKSLLFLHGLIRYDHTQTACPKWVKKLLKMQFQPQVDFCIHRMAQRWLVLNDEIKALDHELAKQAIADIELEKNTFKHLELVRLAPEY